MAKPKQPSNQKKEAETKGVVQPVHDSYARPEVFPTFSAAFGYAKKAVYSITRVREINGKTNLSTMGTAFLAAPNKLLTCAHVLDSVEPEQTNDPMAHHQDGDVYYLLNKDGIEDSHFYHFTGETGKNIELYPAVDAAVITVGEDFYQTAGKIHQHKDVYLKLATVPHDIGDAAGILGFPAEVDYAKKVSGLYIDAATDKLVDDLIKKRADQGIVNARYTDPQDSLVKYDFTMSFNPGNSGGPIIDKDARVIAIIRGYRVFPIKLINETFTITAQSGTPQTVMVPSTIKAIYSTGFSTENLSDIITKHGLVR